MQLVESRDKSNKSIKQNSNIVKSNSSLLFINNRNRKNNSSENKVIQLRNSNLFSYKPNNKRYTNDSINFNNTMLEINSYKTNNKNFYKLKDYKKDKKRKRPNSCIQSNYYNKANNFKYLQRKNVPPHLDVLNLILKNSPQRVDMSLVAQKVDSLNKQYKRDHLNSSTSKKFYEYNIIYGYKSNNIIKTYSPKLAQVNPTSKNKINLTINQNFQVFSEYEIIELFYQKCKDLNVPVKDELMNRFIAYIKEKCTNRIIDLTDCSLGFNSMFALSELLNRNQDICSRLILTKNNFGDMGIELLIEKIKDNSNIVELNLCSNNLGVKGGIIIFNYLINQNSIINLDLSSKEGIYRNRICAEGVKFIEQVLKTNFYLEKIDLSSNSLKNEGLKYLVNGLESNITLQNLILSNNEINEKGILYMETKLISCKLKHLDLSCNPISNNGLISLANCLSGKKLNEISYLNLSECSLTFEAFRLFFKKLSKNHKLQTLIFNKNNLFSYKWESLETTFSGMALKNLSLGSCHLGPVIKDISRVFIRNASIRYLDLSHNQIDDYQFDYFKNYPVNNLALEEIDFSNNFISDRSASSFFKNLMYNSSLQKLNFFDNQLQNESANAILQILKKNHNIVKINIKCNRIGIKMMKEINAQIINNKMIEKGKYLPKLKDELKGLEFNPLEINNLRDRIINSNKERETLSKKFSQEIKEYAYKKQIKMEEAKKIENEFLQIQNKIQKCVNKLKYINEENNNENDFYIKNVDIINDKIYSIEKEIKEINIKKRLYKESQEEEIKLLRDTYESTLNKEQQMKVSISSLSKHLELIKDKYKKKLEYLEKLKNLKIAQIEKKQKETSKNIAVIRKMNKLNSKISRDNFSLVQKKKQKEGKEYNEEDTYIGNTIKKRSQSIKLKIKRENLKE